MDASIAALQLRLQSSMQRTKQRMDERRRRGAEESESESESEEELEPRVGLAAALVHHPQLPKAVTPALPVQMRASSLPAPTPDQLRPRHALPSGLDFLGGVSSGESERMGWLQAQSSAASHRLRLAEIMSSMDGGMGLQTHQGSLLDSLTAHEPPPLRDKLIGTKRDRPPPPPPAGAAGAAGAAGGKTQGEAVNEDQRLLNKIAKKQPSKPLRFTCPEPNCGRMFSWKWTMETHAKTHLGDKGRTHKCDFCGKGFFTAGCLRSHRKTHTRKPGCFPCKQSGCTKSYSTSEGLSLHVRNHHSGEKKWKCPQEDCDRSFVRQADLKLHVIRVHCKKKPFPCTAPECGKSFACLSELKRHMRFHSKNAKK